MIGRVIPDAVLDSQHKASNPAVSAWVSANAGSGKTHVLAQRVIRLLLEGIDPTKILCLTFTKAAAANMANRVFATLSGWIALDDEALDKAIAETGARGVDARRRARARRLFAAALETPGGLKVQTIHAFCTRLLQQFPFEAGVAARFEVLEDTQQKQLIEKLRMDVLIAAATQPESASGRALATVISLASDDSFRRALDAAIESRDKVTAWLAAAGGVEGASAELSRALGIDPADTSEAVERDFFAASLFKKAEWPELVAILAGGSASDMEQAGRLTMAQSAHGRAQRDAYISVFCTGELQPRKNIATKAIRDAHPALYDRLLAEQKRVCALLERQRAIETRERTVALITIAAKVIECYRAEKDKRGLLDFDDLIARSRALLTEGKAAWVHYKLDLGIDHLLIDEAQDTSPEQWDIIRRLTAEFTSGLGAREGLKRSIFVVGDDKQSIFSFQGAAPQEFDAMRRSFRRSFVAAEMGWEDVRLEFSFRSGENVLTAVEQVFRRDGVYRSITSDAAGMAPHQALQDRAPGLVEIWEPVTPEKREETEAWDAPFDRTSPTSPRVKLACRIATAVATWIARREPVGSGTLRRAVSPGDILILVRQRGPLFEAIIRALKNRGIPVAGADRLKLAEHIAVMDLMALADAVLLGDDDLALATVLKSPLFGMSETELFEIAWSRRGTLRAALAERRPELATELDAIAADARRLSPFAFYATLLGAGQGRRKFLARLGAEANDALDEFLNLALDYERREAPSVQGFIAWLRTASAEIKRDMEITRDEVRVMTVHGAKGLEAPIVILADTVTPPEGPAHHQPRLLPLPRQAGVPGAPDPLVWMPPKDDDTNATEEARIAAANAAVDEYRRLLYVAMTRAADRLVVCAALGERRPPSGCWYELVFEALKEYAIEAPADDGEGKVWRFRKAEAADDGTPFPVRPSPAAPAQPDWLKRPVAHETPRAQPVSPSLAHDEQQAARARTSGGSAETRRRALARGAHVHRLLQSLPDVPVERRTEAARRYLARPTHRLDAQQCADIEAHVFRVLCDARFAELFSPGSRAEAPIVGRLTYDDGRELPVAGQVDRLKITDKEVLIADYKTNHPAPRSLDEALAAHAPYVRQLALYRAVLTRIYPHKSVRAALIWTDVPDLMEISPSMLDAELACLTSG